MDADTVTYVVELIIGIITVATVVTGLTSSPKDDEWLKKILEILSLVSNKDVKGTFKLPGQSSKDAEGNSDDAGN